MTDTAALLADIEAYCRAHRLSAKTFGQRAVGNWKFVDRLRSATSEGKPARIWPETAEQVRSFMRDTPPLRGRQVAA